jgi:Transposase, Mutator family
MFPQPRCARLRRCSRRSTPARILWRQQKAVQVIDKLRGSRLTKAVELVETALEETLTYYAPFPEEHWRRIRTTDEIDKHGVVEKVGAD